MPHIKIYIIFMAFSVPNKEKVSQQKYSQCIFKVNQAYPAMHYLKMQICITDTNDLSQLTYWNYHTTMKNENILTNVHEYLLFKIQ